MSSNLLFMRIAYILFLVSILIAIWSCSNTKNSVVEPPSPEPFSDGIHHWNLIHPERNYTRFKTNQYEQIAYNLLAYQNADGGWPKNIDWLAIVDADSVKNSMKERDISSTLDNNNTFSQIEYLARVYMLSPKKRFKTGIESGLHYLLKAQNPSGGWRGWDVDAITFNDQVMTGVMGLFLDITENKEQYKWIPKGLVDSINISLQKAIKVTLKCQIIVNGIKTGWCQQHDHKILKPVKARSFELPSITARESVDIVAFLMKIPNPSPEIIESIKAAVKWLELVKIYGIRLDRIPLEEDKIINKEYPYDLVVVDDNKSNPIWARFYDLDSIKPFMCRRDGRVVYKLSEVDPERRTGYAWYGYWPLQLISVEYPEWLKKNGLY